MTHLPRIPARIRYIAAGAIAALAAAGAIAGTTALAKGGHHTHEHATTTNSGTRPPNKSIKTPASPVPSKTHASQPGSDQPFLSAVQQLVGNGTITAAQGRALDTEIESGTVDSSTFGSYGLTTAQIAAVRQALTSIKESLIAHPQLPSK